MITRIETTKTRTNNVMNRLWEDEEYVEFTRKKMAELRID
jgi:hypothetical protein